MEKMRLQRFLARSGVDSRRHCESIIADGRVTVNGARITTPGTTVSPGVDHIEIDGLPLTIPEDAGRASHVIMLNKPRDYICSRSERQGKTIYSLLPAPLARMVTVGRLDKESEGLLLLSDDGDLVNRLTHPRYGHEKEYEVTVEGAVARDTLRRLCMPVVVDGYRTRPARVDVLRPSNPESPSSPRRRRSQTRLRFVLSEGRNRQIRRICSLAKLQIVRLVRTRISGLRLGKLPPGAHRTLTQEELRQLDALF